MHIFIHTYIYICVYMHVHMPVYARIHAGMHTPLRRYMHLQVGGFASFFLVEARPSLWGLGRPCSRCSLGHSYSAVLGRRHVFRYLDPELGVWTAHSQGPVSLVEFDMSAPSRRKYCQHSAGMQARHSQATAGLLPAMF